MAFISKEELKKIIAEGNDTPAAVVQKLINKGHSLEGYIEKGPKGDRGDRGPMGPTGLTGSQGPQGLTGLPGKDGRDGRDGRDGQDGQNGNDGKNGRDGSPDTAEDIRNKLELLSDEARLDAKYIKNLPQPITQIIESGGGRSFPETELRAGTNITVSKNTFGHWVISSTASGGNGFTVETPTGTVDGSNASFTVSATPVYIVSDGLTYFENAGYTLSGLNVTMTTPPALYIRNFY